MVGCTLGKAALLPPCAAPINTGVLAVNVAAKKEVELDQGDEPGPPPAGLILFIAAFVAGTLFPPATVTVGAETVPEGVYGGKFAATSV